MSFSPISSRARREIRETVGAEHCSDRREDLFLHSYDALNRRFLPEMVAHPATVEEVSRLVSLANREGFSVVPRGAGTGFSGGSLPVEGGLVITTRRMNRILSVDPGNMTAWVEAGVVNGDLQEEAGKSGLFFPPDPSSLHFSTLGGNAAENAGGPRAVKYGVVRDYVMGLEAVMPTGEVIRTGSRAVKSVTGYDLTRLLVGSEGTLGFITKLLLRLIPRPEAVRTILAPFGDIHQASRAVAAIMRSRILPATLEFMDRASIRCVQGEVQELIPEGAEALLLIEVDGPAVLVDQQASRLEAICGEEGCRGFKMASSPAERETLWSARRAISPSLLRIRPLKINEDVAVPRMAVPKLIVGIEEIAGRRNLTIVNFGHAGDGNVHVNILVDPGDEREMERGREAVGELFRLVVDLGGTLSGEHGIGIAKAAFLPMEVGSEEIEVMRRIKRALDPANIFNPSKTFDFHPDLGEREIPRSHAEKG